MINLSSGGAYVYRCMRCGHFWATNAGSLDSFSVITKYCPDCVAHMPVMGRCVA